MNEHLNKADWAMKEKALDYLRKQLAIKIEAKKYHESADLTQPEDVSPGMISIRQYARLQLERDIEELQRHISVIELF